jgi:hypothetical protein
MPNGAQSDNNNPFLSSSAANSLGYKNVIYEPLVMTNVVQPSAAGTPWLATAWTWSNNYQKLVLTIRNGVTWSDGQPLTAADVAYTFNLLKANTTLNANAIKFGTIASSGNTVTLTFPSSQYVYQTQILNQFIVPSTSGRRSRTRPRTRSPTRSAHGPVHADLVLRQHRDAHPARQLLAEAAGRSRRCTTPRTRRTRRRPRR